MKTYSISRWTFLIVSILILALPVSRRWRLILNGEKATGVVTDYRPVLRRNTSDTKTVERVSVVRFRVDDSLRVAFGPEGLEYRTGRRVGVLYDPENPDKNCIFTFTGLYLTDYSALPLILLILWGAFYLSFNNYSKYARKKRGGPPADSPYRPFRGGRTGDHPSRKRLSEDSPSGNHPPGDPPPLDRPTGGHASRDRQKEEGTDDLN